MIDGANVYFVNFDGSVMKVSKTGGPVITLSAPDQHVPSVNGPMAVDATNVYWTEPLGAAQGPAPGINPGMVVSVPIGGGPQTVIASGQGSPVSVAVDATSVYWLNQFYEPQTGSLLSGAVMRATLDGGAPTALATGLDEPIGGFAIDSQCVYWTTPGNATTADPPGLFMVSK